MSTVPSGFAVATTPGQSQSTQDTPQTQSGNAGAASTSSAIPQTRQAAEDARKDRTLAEFMLMLDDYEPLVRFWDEGVNMTAGNNIRHTDSERSDRLLPSASRF